MITDSVVAIVPEELLGEILPVVHRAGLGHLARVLRAKRNPLLDQLQRAGVPASQAPEHLTACESLLVINAAARSRVAGSLAMEHGATQVWIVSGLGEWLELEDIILEKPNVHVLPPHPSLHVPGRGPQHHVVGPDAPPTLDQAT